MGGLIALERVHRVANLGDRGITARELATRLGFDGGRQQTRITGLSGAVTSAAAVPPAVSQAPEMTGRSHTPTGHRSLLEKPAINSSFLKAL